MGRRLRTWSHSTRGSVACVSDTSGWTQNGESALNDAAARLIYGWLGAYASPSLNRIMPVNCSFGSLCQIQRSAHILRLGHVDASIPHLSQEAQVSGGTSGVAQAGGLLQASY